MFGEGFVYICLSIAAPFVLYLMGAGVVWTWEHINTWRKERCRTRKLLKSGRI